MLESKYTALLAEASRQGSADPSCLHLCFQLLSLAAAIDRDCAARLAPHGLSEARFVILFLLRGAGSPLSPNALAERAGVRRATITGLLDGMAGEGLLTRHPDADDGRRLQVRLTRKGKRLADATFSAHTAWITGLFAVLDATEREQLGTLLAKVWQRTDTGAEGQA